ncbi:MAG: SIS domain-containing protein [archaeon]|nr:SIS domain-containing protein [archaeon]
MNSINSYFGAKIGFYFTFIATSITVYSLPAIFGAVKDKSYEKVLANIEEIKARGGIVIAVASENDKEIKNHSDSVIYISKTIDMLQPLLSVLPLQLLAYFIADKRGCDIDKPRNLAKSVTVE